MGYGRENDMERNELLKNLDAYGYSLLGTFSLQDPEKVLEGLLSETESRLVEGFPVVLAEGMRRKQALDWETSSWEPKKKLRKKEYERWQVLMAVSVFLFRLFGLEETLRGRAKALLLKSKDGKTCLKELEKPFQGSQEVRYGGFSLSAVRVKESFRLYVTRPPVEAAGEKVREFEMELLLSELFTPRQKQVLRKRLEGKPLTKTEREVYYRVVKKRLKALADEGLHQLAKRVLAA